jgi:outer membrane lipoprotein carrier protein
MSLDRWSVIGVRALAVATLIAIQLSPSSVLAAPEADPASGIAQLRVFVEGTRAAHGEFTQRTTRTDGPSGRSEQGRPEQSRPEAPRTVSGRFAFARPGRFRWEVIRPDDQLIVSDGKQVWFHDRDLDQVSVRPLGDSIGSSPAAILFGSDAIEREFAVRDMGVRDGAAWIEATPHRKDAGFERIAIGLRQGLPVAMEIRDAFGQLTRLSFDSVRRDAQPDLNQFRFVAPTESGQESRRK